MTKVRRYKCLACGNLTRFDVIRRERVREFHHFTTGGELNVEDAETLECDGQHPRRPKALAQDTI